MSSIDLLESKLSTLLSKLATLEVNKLFFNSKFPDGIDVGGGTVGPIGPQGPQGNRGPLTVPAGIFYIAFFANATTRPAFLRTTSTVAVILNGILSTANAAFASANTGRTTSMPATLGAFTAVSAGYWTGVS